MRRRRILFTGFLARMEDTRTAGWGRGLRGGAGKRVDGVLPGRPQNFRHQHRPMDDSNRGRGEELCKTAEQGSERFMAKGIAAEKARAGL